MGASPTRPPTIFRSILAILDPPFRQAKLQVDSLTAASSPVKSSWRTRLPFFYGWAVLASVVVILAIGYGAYYSFSVFYVALLQEFEWSRGAAAGVFSVFVMTIAVGGIGGGALIDRLGPSRVVPVGGVLLATGLFASSQLTELWEFYLYFGVLCGLSLSLAGWVPGITVASRWFSQKGGLAIGIASAGVGLGIVIFAPFSQYLISTVGWRAAYQLLAVLALFGIAPLAFLIQVGRPEEIGLKPDGIRSGQRTLEPSRKARSKQVEVLDTEWASRPWTLRSSLVTRRLWLLLGAITFGVLNNQMLWVHQAAYLVDGGYDRMLAASTVGLAGFVSIFGKILWGVLCDRLGREWALTLGSLAVTASILLLILSRVVISPWIVFLFAVVFAIGYASVAPIVSTATADLFVGRHFGSIYGFVCLGQGIGGSLGAWLAGYIFDITGSYLSAFALAAASFVVGVLCLWMAAPRRVRRITRLSTPQKAENSPSIGTKAAV